MADKFQLKAILSAVDKISPVLKNVQRASKLTYKSIRDIGNAGGELMRKIGIPAFLSLSALTVGLIRTSKASIEFASNIQDGAGRAQAGVEDYQALSNMLGLVGGSAEDAEMSFVKFSKGAGEASRGKNASFLALLKKLKIPLKDAKGNAISLTSALPALANGFAKTKNENVRTNMAMALFGKGGTKMIPVLLGIADGSIALADAQKRMGAIVGKDSVDALDDLGDSLTTVETQTKATITNALGKLVPVIKPIIDNLGKWIGANQELIQTSIVSTLTEIATALKDVDWKATITDLKETAKTVRDVVQALGGVKGLVIGLGVAWLAGPLAAILSIIGAVFRLGSALVILVGGWGAIGGMLLRVIGFGRTLLGILPLIGNAILFIGRAFLLTPIGLVLGLVTAAILIYKNWDKIKVWFNDFAKWLGAKVTAIAQTLKGLVPDWIKNLFSSNANLNITGAGGTPLSNNNALGAGKQQLNGEMTMRFENAPPGFRVDSAKSNQPGLNINPDVGYRSGFGVLAIP